MYKIEQYPCVKSTHVGDLLLIF